MKTERATSIRDLVADDGYAVTFQTMGQYRTALLKAIEAATGADPLRPAVESMVSMLEDGEWAEHVASTTGKGDSLAQRLEDAITQLHNDVATAGRAEDAPDAARLDGDELDLFCRTVDELQDCNEASTPYETMLDWARRGLLECTLFETTEAGRAQLDAMSASQEGA